MATKSAHFRLPQEQETLLFSMIKVGGLVEENKCVPCTKYIVSTVSNVSNNAITLNGAELIPIDLDGRLINQSNVSINQELGKQLLKAAADGKVDDLKALLTKGAPFTADWLGTSPLHLAAQNNHLEITEILLRAGISKDARTKVDRTPLHMAAYEGHLQIVDTLIKHGADIDCKDLLGMTPLHWAVQNGHYSVVEFLVSNGAEVNDCNKFNLTPMMIARQIGRTDIEDFLTTTVDDSTVAAQNLVIQLSSDDSVVDGNDAQGAIEDMDIEENTTESIIIPIEPNILDHLSHHNDEMDGNSNVQDRIEDEFEEHNSVDVDNTENDDDDELKHMDSNNFTDSLKLLHDDITMLQNDENEDNILNSAMESGHSVVLTDVGKELLNSVKQSEQKQQMQQQHQQQQLLIEKKIVTVTPEEFLAMTNSALNKKVIKQLKCVPKNQVRRIVMKRTKTLPLPVTTVVNMPEPSDKSFVTGIEQNQQKNDMELVMSELVQARKTIEEYKIKLRKKEQETERYKMQLKLLMDPS